MTDRPRVVYTDFGFPDISVERAIVEEAGGELVPAQCTTPAEVIAAARGADALLVQWAPVTAEVIATLDRCRAIVRIGIGVDNVDLQAAAAARIPVCNVPDYCLDEVADHALALALALARQLPQIDARVRAGTWSITPPAPMPAFREMTFATVGLGRIARRVLDRARPFGFRLAAYDPAVAAADAAALGVDLLALDDLVAVADLLSLHCPHTPETHHLLNAERLARMKPTAVVVNTSRGALVDGAALAAALAAGHLGGAGLDVFDPEPLPPDDPLRTAPNALLTSHVSWYSAQSVPRLQRLAAEEAARALRGEPLLHPVSPS
jgi:D-3-phosphoglycerate dehydrogenase